MKIKNVIIGSAVAALLMGSSVAMAAPGALTTTNNSSQFSAVSVGGTCSGSLGQWTGPEAGHTKLSTPWVIVRSICGFKSPCTATLYVGDKAAATTCKTDAQTKTAQATIDLSTGVITPKALTVNGVSVTTGVGSITMNNA